MPLSSDTFFTQNKNSERKWKVSVSQTLTILFLNSRENKYATKSTAKKIQFPIHVTINHATLFQSPSRLTSNYWGSYEKKYSANQFSLSILWVCLKSISKRQHLTVNLKILYHIQFISTRAATSSDLLSHAWKVHTHTRYQYCLKMIHISKIDFTKLNS